MKSIERMNTNRSMYFHYLNKVASIFLFQLFYLFCFIFFFFNSRVVREILPIAADSIHAHVYNYIYVTIAEYCCDGLMARRRDAHGIIHSWVIILIFNVKGAKGYLLFCRIYKVQVLLGGKGPMVRGMESKKKEKEGENRKYVLVKYG